MDWMDWIGIHPIICLLINACLYMQYIYTFCLLFPYSMEMSSNENPEKQRYAADHRRRQEAANSRGSCCSSSPPRHYKLPSWEPSGALARDGSDSGGQREEKGSRGGGTTNDSHKKHRSHNDDNNEEEERRRKGRKRHISREHSPMQRPRNDSRSPRRHSPSERKRRQRDQDELVKREPADVDCEIRNDRKRDWSRDHHNRRDRDDGRGRRDFVKKEPPPGGWNKPSWEPSGSLKKEPTAENETDGSKESEKEKPSFEPSGKLAKDTNTFKGVLIKYNEPPEAKIPKVRWRMYPFKGSEYLPVIYVHRQSAYLIGRDRKIADFPIDHPSTSKQHAALQYRSLPFERADGSRGRRTRPYIIDLGSGNGTFLNGERIESQRYYELKEKDVLRFGFSSREYVMLNEQSLEANGDSDTSEEEDEAMDVIDRAGGEERLADEDDLF